MKTQLLLAAALLGSATAAQALPIAGGTVTASDATGATASPFALTNLGTSTTSGFQSNATFTAADGSVVSFSPDTAAPLAGVYAGSITNTSTSPFTGNSLGSALSNYLTAEPSDNVTLTFSSAQSAFNLLWGTVDTFNSLNLELLSGSTVVGNLTVTGSEVAAAVGGGFAANGTTGAFVSIADSAAAGFTTVVATSTTQAFEFVPGAGTAVPEPATLALLGFGLLGLGFVQHRRSRG